MASATLLRTQSCLCRSHEMTGQTLVFTSDMRVLRAPEDVIAASRFVYQSFFGYLTMI